MRNRKWSPEQKAKIVLEGLSGRLIQEICCEYEIAQAQYYQWKDQFLRGMNKAFIREDKEKERLIKRNARLEREVGKLTMELKKTEELAW